jgi:hypothetical protein
VTRAIRLEAAKALGEAGDRRVVPILIEGLRIFVDQDHILARQIADALAAIAGRDPVPELRAALPLVRGTGGIIPFYHDAAERIEAATAAIRDTPLPADAPHASDGTLPIPADVRDTPIDELPLVAHQEEGD